MLEICVLLHTNVQNYNNNDIYRNNSEQQLNKEMKIK